MNRLFSTKTLVATALGAALFFVLFSWIKIPSPIPNTNFQVAYGVSGFFGAVFGPVSGFLVPFIGHGLSDTVFFGAPWWSWVTASGISGLVASLSFFFIKFGGPLSTKILISFNLLQIAGHAFSWLIVAPALDIWIYKESVELVSAQGAIAFAMNAISTGVVGTLLLVAYSKRQTASASLSED